LNNEKLEDTKEVTSRTTDYNGQKKNDRQYNGQKKITENETWAT
jgi:hypothetical protein